MKETEEHTCHSLSANFKTLNELAQDSGIGLGKVFDVFEDKGFGLLLIILSLPSALPVPAAGYSTPFGILILLLGLQMLVGRHSPWLPQKARKLTLSKKMTTRVTRAGNKILSYIEHLIKPRLSWLTHSSGRRLMAVLVIIMSCLMILPIPTTNTFPAFVIFLIGIGLSEEDGLFGVGAIFIGILAVLLYAFIIYIAIHLIGEYGWEGLSHLKEVVKQQLM